MKVYFFSISLFLFISSCTGQNTSENKKAEQLNRTTMNSIEFEKKIEKGIKEYQTWDHIKLVNEAAYIYAHVGHPYYAEDTNRLIIALKYLDRAIGLNDTNKTAYHNKFNILSSLGRYTEALTILQYLVSHSKQNGESYLIKGLIFEKMGKIDSAQNNYKLAIESYDQRIKIKPEINILIKRAILLNLTIGNQASINAINEVIKTYPKNKQAQFAKDEIIMNFDRKKFIEDNIP